MLFERYIRDFECQYISCFKMHLVVIIEIQYSTTLAVCGSYWLALVRYSGGYYWEIEEEFMLETDIN